MNGLEWCYVIIAVFSPLGVVSPLTITLIVRSFFRKVTFPFAFHVRSCDLNVKKLVPSSPNYWIQNVINATTAKQATWQEQAWQGRLDGYSFIVSINDLTGIWLNKFLVRWLMQPFCDHKSFLCSPILRAHDKILVFKTETWGVKHVKHCNLRNWFGFSEWFKWTHVWIIKPFLF